MNRVKNIFLVVHIVLWTLFSLLVALQLGGEGNPRWFATSIGFTLTCLYVFYGHFFLLTYHSGKIKKRDYFFIRAGIMLSGPVPFLLFRYEKLNAWNLLSESYFMLLISAVPIFMLLSWLARVTENLVLNTIKKEQLEKQAVEAELYYLKSQINPHFLFNTLHNIHTLVYKQAPAAPEAVLHLASLMRYMIYESNAPTVPIAKEIAYLQDYMNLQQLRYKQSPVVDLKIVGDTSACHIAPLLFIHLLENAYKHSPARLNPGDLKVSVEVQKNNLTFSVQNPVDKHPAHNLNDPGGIGLPNVRKRLALLYSGQHTLKVTNMVDTFSVVLNIHSLQSETHEG
ncbi:sensor histidine kinase [Emticicia sp. BO119]|uniref:sensor histidine kinase n=1 Tax=Emticicia sp. BO119 TaxID=2757768 RepID=UPI0015EFF639|nr:sensor histidine kinase [Emticicia sp. BO119]MBA4850363.1 sensor histidine kinase [Emticicia sp. BO119]